VLRFFNLADPVSKYVLLFKPYIYNYKKTKMKQIILLCYFFTIILFTSCGKSALTYNNELAKIQYSFEKAYTKAEDDLGRFFKENKKDSIKDVANKMNAILDTKIAAINALEMPKATKVNEMKSAYISYFQFYKTFLNSCINYATQKKDDDIANARAELLDLSNKEDSVVTTLQEIHKSFASANNIKIKKK
jgi:hypothetical protein